MTLIEAPEGAEYLSHTIIYAPKLSNEGELIESYELILEADFFPCGCTNAPHPECFKEIINQWSNTGTVYLP